MFLSFSNLLHLFFCDRNEFWSGISLEVRIYLRTDVSHLQMQFKILSQLSLIREMIIWADSIRMLSTPPCATWVMGWLVHICSIVFPALVTNHLLC